MALRSGRHFLQIPGPTTCPTACCARSTGRPSTIEVAISRGSAAKCSRACSVFSRRAATCSSIPPRVPGRGRRRSSTRCRPATVLMFETGHFATLWRRWPRASGSTSTSCRATGAMASIPTRSERLSEIASAHQGRLVVHNETSTGVASRIRSCAARSTGAHPALLLVDTISSLGSIDYRHDEWGVDVTVAGLAEGAHAAAGACRSTRCSDKAFAASRSTA